MTDRAAATTSATMKTVRFHGYGEPGDVLRLEDAAVPTPNVGRIRVAVHACGLNPADWALCRGLFAGDLPRGVGLDVSGRVDAIGAGVTDVKVGDLVLGAADFAGYASAGVSEQAILRAWAKVPDGLDLVDAAALPLVVETAYRSLDSLEVTGEHTVLVHGAGTMVGFAAVQIARRRGARVIATAGHTFADRLRAFGATVTGYGDGLVDRVRAADGSSPDLVLDTAPPSGVLPDLVAIAGGDPRKVLTISDMVAAATLGVRTSFTEADARERYDVLGEFAQLAADKRFSIPVARTFALAEWRAAVALSQGGQPGGKVVILASAAAAR